VEVFDVRVLDAAVLLHRDADDGARLKMAKEVQGFGAANWKRGHSAREEHAFPKWKKSERGFWELVLAIHWAKLNPRPYWSSETIRNGNGDPIAAVS
jgi:hypothetical protein